jgi:hypothetical protein
MEFAKEGLDINEGSDINGLIINGGSDINEGSDNK